MSSNLSTVSGKLLLQSDLLGGDALLNWTVIRVIAAVSLALSPLFFAEAGAETASVNLPPGFEAMQDNAPPSHEAYVRYLEGDGHNLTFSADRRPLESAFELLEKHGAIMVRPTAVALLSFEISLLEASLTAPRTGWITNTEFLKAPAGMLPNELCDGLQWTTNFKPDDGSAERVGFRMHGFTIACVFFGTESAWMTTATVAELFAPALGQELTGNFEKTARQILGSMQY